MATFNIHLDTRRKNKAGQYNLTVRACIENKTRYINARVKMSLEQYDRIFTKKSMDTYSIQFREEQNALVSKCERLYSQLNPFDYNRFRELFYEKEKTVPQTLLIEDLIERYIDTKEIKIGTKKHLKYTSNTLCKYKNNLSVWDITPEFLGKFEKSKMAAGITLDTINSYHRDLRAVLKYFSSKEKLLPQSYVHPYGNSGHMIKSANPQKLVLKENEIEKVINHNDFENDAQKYARDVWAFLYYCNGINFVDLFRMRWDNRNGNYLLFTRKKTETTRKNHIKPVCVPITGELQGLLDSIGDKTSPFILGEIKEDYTETTFYNKFRKVRKKINSNLTSLGTELDLSVPLKLKTARDCYAMSLKRAKVSLDDIAEMLNHQNPQTTLHYLGSMDVERTDEINSFLVKKNTPENTPEFRKTDDN